MRFEYLLVLFLSALVPAIFCRHPSLPLARRGKAAVKAILIPSFVFWCWDIAATFRGHWSFNPKFVIGVTLVNLPIEEYLFFIVVGFVSVFTYEVVISKLPRKT